MAKPSSTRYRGGPLADYSDSFTGLGGEGGFYEMQKPGATQQEKQQFRASQQQAGAGGFYRPGFEPRATPMVAPPPKRRVTPVVPLPDSAGADQVLGRAEEEMTRGTLSPQAVADARTLYGRTGDVGRTRKLLSDLFRIENRSDRRAAAGKVAPVPMEGGELAPSANAKPMGGAPIARPGTPEYGAFIAEKPKYGTPEYGALSDEVGRPPPPPLVDGVFAAPPGMVSGDLATAPFRGAQPVGRSMKDPSRMVEMVARRNRNDPRTQMAAAGFFQNRADAEAAGAAAAERFAFEQDKFNLQEGRLQGTARETVRHNRATEERLLNSDAVRRNMELARIGTDMSREARAQAEYEQSLRKPEFMPVQGSGGGIVMQGNAARSGYIPTPGAAGPPVPMEVMPGSGVYAPSFGGEEPDKSFGTFEMTAPPRPAMNLPSMSLPWLGNTPKVDVPAQKAQFQLKQTVETLRDKQVDRLMKLYEDLLTLTAPSGRERAQKEIDRLEKELAKDGDGVVEPGGSSGSAQGAAAQAVRSLTDRALKKS